MIQLDEFKSGIYTPQDRYSSFSPYNICKEWTCTSPEINELLGEANRQVGALDAYATLIPDIDFFIRMHITKEATTSSKIEGTQTNFEEAFIAESDINPEKRDDWQEVNNYVKAMNHAPKRLSDLPISTRLIKETHEILLSGARGKEKLPGQFRRSQNWIGPSLKNAYFIPPHFQEIDELMSDLEKFVHSELTNPPIRVPHLIKIALIHYQFETIHPFLDGNGRIGRLLITLYLLDKRLLHKPTLYLSAFFEKNRAEYYSQLDVVRQKNMVESWIKFFLRGVIDTATNSINTFKEIIKLREEIEFKILPKLGRSQKNGQILINSMYKNPIADGNQIATLLDLHSSNANKLIRKLTDLGLIEELTGYQRNRIFSFIPYIKIFKEN